MLFDKFKKILNGGKKYQNSDIINDMMIDYIEWHHRKNGFFNS
jgi:hypothetical protein